MAHSTRLPLPPAATELAAGAGTLPSGGEAARHADFDLVQRLVGGDSAAWRTLVVRYQRLVVSRVLATAREMNHALAAADAEDLCAEVFSRLVADDFSALRRFEGRCSLSTWLAVVTRRIVARRLATLRSFAAWNAAGDAPLDSLAAASSEEPSAAMISAEERARLAQGIAELGQRQQELARLHFFEGRSYREISEQLAMPMNSIGPTLARIQEKLRKHMSRGE